MMRRTLIAASLGLLTAASAMPAAADGTAAEGAGTAETAAVDPAAQAAVEPPTEVDVRFWPEPGLHARGYLTSDVGNRIGAGAALGGEIGLSGAGCGELSTGGELGLRYGQDRGLSATHWARACLPTVHLVDGNVGTDIIIVPIRLEQRLEWNVLPRLAARRLVWNLPYTHERVSGSTALAAIAPTMLGDVFPGWDLLAMPVDAGGDWWTQRTDGGAAMRSTSSELGVAMVELRERAGGGDGSIVIFRGAWAGDIARIDLVKVTRAPLPGVPLRADLALGSADTTRYVEGALARTGGLTGRLGLWLDLGAVLVGGGIQRDVYPTIDDAILSEDRADVAIEYTRDAGRAVSLTAFYARPTLAWTDGSGELAYDPTYGVELAAKWRLTGRLFAQVDLGVGRSFYTGPTDAMLPAPRLGGVIATRLAMPFGR